MRCPQGAGVPDPAKYRQLSVPLSGEVDEGTDAAVAALNSHFSPDDFHVLRDGANLDVWLRQLDLDSLADAVESVLGSHPTALPLRQIDAAVRKIRSYGINGGKRLYVGYNRERKVVDRLGKVRRRGKHYYANDHAFASENDMLPGAFVDRVVCGDSEEVLRQLPDNSVDLVFTSPPYNFGLEYDGDGSNGDDARDWESYFAKLFRVFDECIRVLAFGGRIVVNVQPLFSDYIPSHHIRKPPTIAGHMCDSV